MTAGRGTAFDVERARSVLQLTLAAVPDFESQIATGRYRIVACCSGVRRSSSGELMADLAAMPHLPDSVTRFGSPRDVVRRRPDVLAAERQLAAQSLSVGASQAEYCRASRSAASAGYTANRFESLTRTGTSRVAGRSRRELSRCSTSVASSSASGSPRRVRTKREAQYTATVLRAVEETESAVVTYDRAHERRRHSRRGGEVEHARGRAGAAAFRGGAHRLPPGARRAANAARRGEPAHSGQTAAATSLIAVYKATGGSWPAR